MGVWATGLYGGDFALDLRSTIAAIAKLPFDSDRLLDILCESERGAADRTDDPDHTTFWLVVADQFAKRGIDSKRAKDTALEIIDSRSDLIALERLGMQVPDLRKREKVLEEVRQRIVAPAARTNEREAIKTPQPLLMQTGDVLVYPTFGGRCRNPYVVNQDKDRMGGACLPWQIDSWAAMVIIDSGRAFDFLAWYRPVVVARAMIEKPNMATLEEDLTWRLTRAGTSTASHFKRMGIEKNGTLAIDREKLKTCFGELPPGTSDAVGNISIANRMNVEPCVPTDRMGKAEGLANLRPAKPLTTISGLRQIAER
jgi:hypothetical protein